ncbi:MAG: hypothetical protein Q9M89_00565 [Persephonella sp.]|nr:hypothetical protein [Persephonella sp.]
MLASIIGEGELSETEKKYLQFGRRFEKEFVKQGRYEDRTLKKTMEIGWKLLKLLPVTELTRLTDEDIQQFITGEKNGTSQK